MNNLPLLNDLRVFMLVARRAGFAAAAEELGVSPAFISKRVSLLEQTLNVVLLHRTTRRVTITEEGERIYEWAQRILQDVDEMMDELSDVRQVPQGTLRIISSFGFGRRVVAPALSALALQYPQLELRFDVQDRLVDLVNEGVDLDIRVGDDIAPNLIARQRAGDAGEQTHRTQVDVLVKLTAELQQRPPQRNVVGNGIRPADGAEVDGIEALQLLAPVVRHHLAVMGIIFAACPLHLLEAQ